MNKMNLLSKAEMKKVTGGVVKLCGVKIDGTWYSVGGGRSEAEGLLGYTGSFNNGEIYGTVTNWCCDSCYWN